MGNVHDRHGPLKGDSSLKVYGPLGRCDEFAIAREGIKDTVFYAKAHERYIHTCTDDGGLLFNNRRVILAAGLPIAIQCLKSIQCKYERPLGTPRVGASVLRAQSVEYFVKYIDDVARKLTRDIHRLCEGNTTGYILIRLEKWDRFTRIENALESILKDATHAEDIDSRLKFLDDPPAAIGYFTQEYRRLHQESHIGRNIVDMHKLYPDVRDPPLYPFSLELEDVRRMVAKVIELKEAFDSKNFFDFT